jgi:AcrR family transcriptional regulator
LSSEPSSSSVPAARPTGGLRERKKQKTKDAIQREAMRLFQSQGYEETTIEDIAAAADISPSTFFNYFPTKEDVVLYDSYDPVMVEFMMSRPADEPLSQVLQHTLRGLAAAIEKDRDMVLARAKLGLQAPGLRARFWGELERARDLVAGILAARTGRDAADFEIRVLAMVLITATFEASEEWVRRDGRGDMFQLVDEALGAIHMWQRLDALAQRAAKGDK